MLLKISPTVVMLDKPTRARTLCDTEEEEVEERGRKEEGKDRDGNEECGAAAAETEGTWMRCAEGNVLKNGESR